MNNKKTLLVALSAVIASAAHAQYTSPEMALVTDLGGTTKSGGTVQAQVERYDTTTGQYLGAFGAGYLHNPSGVTVVGQEAYVADYFVVGSTFYSKIDKFNFSTGAFDGSIFNANPYAILGISTYNGNVLATDYGNPNASQAGEGVYTLGPDGSQVGFVPVNTGYTAWQITTDATKAYVALVNTSGINGGLDAYTLNADGTYNSSSFQTHDGQFVGTTVSHDGSGNERVYGAGYDGNGKSIICEYDTNGNLISSFTDTNQGYYGLATGHHGVVYGLDFNSGGTGFIVQRFDNNLGVQFGPLGSFNLDYSSNNAQSLAIYAAPEPISTSAIMLGLGGLMLRRRKRA